MPYSVLEQLEATDKPLDVKRVAEIFGEKPRTIYNMANDGRLPCFRLGATIKFCPTTLSHFIRKQNKAFAAARREAERVA